MANRRQFIQSGLLAASAALLPSLTFSLPLADIHSASPTCFVFDKRFDTAIRMSRHMARQGLSTAEFMGDLTELWSGYLGSRWKQTPMTLAGFTTHHGLFVLETLAADYRMHVVYRGAHAQLSDGSMEHHIAGPAALVAHIAAALEIHPSASQTWPAQLSRALGQWQVGDASTTKLLLTTPAQKFADHEDTLFSWIIAPRAIRALRV